MKWMLLHNTIILVHIAMVFNSSGSGDPLRIWRNWTFFSQENVSAHILPTISGGCGSENDAFWEREFGILCLSPPVLSWTHINQVLPSIFPWKVLLPKWLTSSIPLSLSFLLSRSLPLIPETAFSSLGSRTQASPGPAQQLWCLGLVYRLCQLSFAFILFWIHKSSLFWGEWCQRVPR